MNNRSQGDIGETYPDRIPVAPWTSSANVAVDVGFQQHDKALYSSRNSVCTTWNSSYTNIDIEEKGINCVSVCL